MNCFQYYFRCRASQSTHTCPTTTEITQPDTLSPPNSTDSENSSTSFTARVFLLFTCQHSNICNRFSYAAFLVPAKKPNRLLSLTFDFHSPKLRISFKSIIPTTFWSQRHTYDPDQFRLTRSLLHQKSNKSLPKPIVSAQKTTAKLAVPFLLAPRWAAASFLFRCLRPFPSPRLFLYRLQTYSSIMSLYSCTSYTLVDNSLRSSRMFLSMSVQCLVFSNSRIIVGNKESASRWSCP